LINKDGKKISDSLSNKRNEIKTPITGRDFIQKTIPTNRYGAVVQKYFIQKSFLIENNLTFEKGYIHEDESFTLEVLCLADRLTFLSEPMIKKRVRDNSIMSSKKGIKNVAGWAKAIERVLHFLEREEIDPKTRKFVLIRLRQLAHTAIRTLNSLDQPKEQVDHYLPVEAQNKLGLLVKTHARSPFLYRVFKYVNRKISLPD
jgi:hypothetical protein